MIDIRDLSFRYYSDNKDNPIDVLHKISLSVKKSSFISILGPSGSGKTTLLHCLGGLLPKYEGEIVLNGKMPLETRNRHEIGLVSQKPIFFEWLTIKENVMLPLKIAKRTERENVTRYLDKFGLIEYTHSYPHELSGGMLARVALARALVNDPVCILLDEAFNFLDEALREKINQDIQDYWINNKPTILAVTHNISEAVYLSDKIMILSHKPATIIKIIDIPFTRPRDYSLLFDKDFIEIVNKIRTTLKELYNKKA